MCVLVGEFGSVREAFFKMEDSTVQKVAVKVLKSESVALIPHISVPSHTDCF